MLGKCGWCLTTKQTWFISENTSFVACEICRFPTWILNRQWPPQRRDNPSSSAGPWYLRQGSRKYIPRLGRYTCGKDQESIFLGWAVILRQRSRKYIPGLCRDTCGKDQESISIFLGWAVIPAAKIKKVYSWAGPWYLRQRSRKYIHGLGREVRDTCRKYPENIYMGWAVISFKLLYQKYYQLIL